MQRKLNVIPGLLIVNECQTGLDNIEERPILDRDLKNRVVVARPDSGSAGNEAGKIVMGYTAEGLPFQLVVHVENDENAEQVMAFVDTHVTPLIDGTAEALSPYYYNNPMDLLIAKIKQLKIDHHININFSLSLAMVYTKNNEWHCAGFGNGQTGIGIVNEGKYEQLAYATYPADDAGEPTYTYVNTTVPGNNTFNRKVVPGNELFAYSALPEDLSANVGEKVLSEGDRNPVSSFRLCTEKLNKQKDLFIENVQEAFKTRNNQGRSALLGVVSVPKVADKILLQYKIYNQEVARMRDQLERDGVTAEVKAKGHAIIATIEKMRLAPEASLPTFTRCLADCNRALRKPDQNSLEALNKRAEKVRESNSPWSGILASMLMGLGLGLLISGLIFTLCATIGVASPLAPAAIGMLFAGIGMMAAGAAITATSVTLFARASMRHGLQKEIHQLSEEIRKSPLNN